MTWLDLSYLIFRFRNTCSVWSIVIAVTSHEGHSVLQHRQLDCLFNNFSLATHENSKVQHYWSFVRRIHRWPVVSPHKRPVIRKAFPWHDLITCNAYVVLSIHTFLCRFRSEFVNSEVYFTLWWSLWPHLWLDVILWALLSWWYWSWSATPVGNDRVGKTLTCAQIKSRFPKKSSTKTISRA